jgi:hypothetical protein
LIFQLEKATRLETTLGIAEEEEEEEEEEVEGSGSFLLSSSYSHMAIMGHIKKIVSVKDKT